eukprot:3369129-Pyramimonas_sp.AAC.1
MEECVASVPPATQGHSYRRMQKCPCMQFTLVLCDHCNDDYGAGMKTYERSPSRVSDFARRRRADQS